jgi:3-oxoacid CoA-transferase
MILSYVGTNKSLQEAYLAGKVTLELSPQGTIAERLRAGGAGIPAVITPTGAGTFVETGGIPRRLSLKDDTAEGGKQTVLLEGKKKKVMEFEGKRFLLEPAIKGDVAIIRAHKVDKAGNCVFRYTTKAFAGLMARAAKLTIVEAEHIVEIGQIPPEEVDLPGIYVDRIVPATAEKQIEITVLKEEPPTSSSSSASSSSSSDAASVQKKDPARIRRELIARRAAKELKDGFYCNLGVGMPVLAASYLAPGTNVWLQSENGILGMGPYPTPEQVDA